LGETQLEIDRRLIRRRIARLASDLRDIETERDEPAAAALGRARVAWSGTECRKIDVMNLLTGAGTRVENRLFSTLDPLVRPQRARRTSAVPRRRYGRLHPQASTPPRGVVRSTLKRGAGGDLLVHVSTSFVRLPAGIR